jgi:hypothetical protein
LRKGNRNKEGIGWKYLEKGERKKDVEIEREGEKQRGRYRKESRRGEKG